MNITTRPLDASEIGRVLDALDGLREKCFFTLGLLTGFRVAELCSIRVKDVWQFGMVRTSVTVAKGKMKGKGKGRTVALGIDAQRAIFELVVGSGLKEMDYLFKSRQGKNKPITPQMARLILKTAYNAAGIEGNVATHSMRKTFAHNIFEASGRDLVKTQKGLGHKSIDSTVKYLSVEQGQVDELVVGIRMPK